MTLPALLAQHIHVSEREVAHTWPDGQSDDSKWEDCTMDSGTELARLCHDPAIPATHVESEHLRDDAGVRPIGGTTIANLVKGYAVRYKWTAGLQNVSGFATLWAALTPGKAAVAQGSYVNFPIGYTLRRFEPSFTGGHAVFVARVDSQDRVWWCDPLAPQGTYQGQWVTKADLKKYVDSFDGNHLVSTIIKPVTPTPAEPPMPILTAYLPGYSIVVKSGSNIRKDPSTAASPIRVLTKDETWSIIGTVNGATLSGVAVWYLRWAGGQYEYVNKNGVSSGPKAPVTDCSPAVVAAVTPLNTSIANQKATIDQQAALLASQKTLVAELQSEIVRTNALRTALKAFLG